MQSSTPVRSSRLSFTFVPRVFAMPPRPTTASQSAGPSASASRAGSELERLPAFRRAGFVRPCVDAQPERILLLLDTRDDLRADCAGVECPWGSPRWRDPHSRRRHCPAGPLTFPKHPLATRVVVRLVQLLPWHCGGGVLLRLQGQLGSGCRREAE